MPLSQLPRHSHIEDVCQLKAHPLETKTEAKPTLPRQLVSRRPTGEGALFAFPPFQNKFPSLPFQKCTLNIHTYLLSRTVRFQGA